MNWLRDLPNEITKYLGAGSFESGDWQIQKGKCIMTIEAGQSIPSVNFQIKTEDGINEHSSDDYFGSGRTVLFALPGAFTPTCSARHLPSYLEKNAELGRLVLTASPVWPRMMRM